MFSFIDPTLIGPHVVLAAALALAPGPDVFFVVANSIQRGPIGGWASAAGIGVGSILHAFAAAIGVSAALAASPVFFYIADLGRDVFVLLRCHSAHTPKKESC